MRASVVSFARTIRSMSATARTSGPVESTSNVMRSGRAIAICSHG